MIGTSFHELAVEAGAAVLPQRAQHGDVLVRTLAAALEGHAEGIELLLEPADADAEIDAPAAEQVQGRHLLRQHQRVAQRQDEHAGHEPQARRRRSHPGHPDQRIGDRRGRVAGQPAARGIGVSRLVVEREDDVVDGDHRVKANVLGQPRDAARVLGIGERVVAEMQGELHG
jgi:hypothetical protein